MTRKDVTFRITKIGKTAVSVAVCSLLASLPMSAIAVNYFAPTSFTVATDSNSVGMTYSNGTGSYTYADPFSITLSPGVDLSGQTTAGNVPLAVFSFSTWDDNLSLVQATLNLQGDNQLAGRVGVRDDGLTPDRLLQINLNGTNVSFSDLVYAQNIDFTQGGTAQFYGNVSSASATAVSLDYNGNNASTTLHDGVVFDGNITNTAKNGSLIFTGDGTVNGNVASGSTTNGAGTAIGNIEIRGANSVVRFNGGVSTDRLDYQAASTVAVTGDLYLNADTSTNAVNGVRFNNNDGTLQIGAGSDLQGILGKAAVSTTLNNTGTLTMVSGTQTVIGNLGAAGLALKTVNIGGANTGVALDASDNVASNTTVSGHVFAQTIQLNSNDSNSADTADSHLTMASGYNITGNVVTETTGRGILTMAGGTQTVTGNVGATGALRTVESGATDANTTFTGTVAAVNVNNTGAGTSNFQDAVTATTVNVAAGISNFVKSLTATTTNISTGTGNFNTDGASITTSKIVFSGAGTANLVTGLTGVGGAAIDFGGQANATVNLYNGQTITGTVDTTVANTGILNALGGGTLSSDVGATNAIKTLNVNTTAGASRTLVANGNVSAQSISLQNDGVLQMANTKNLTGAVTTTTANTGALTFLGTSTVTGAVGTGAAPLKAINAGATGATVTFGGGVAYANTLAYSGNGTVVFNGSSPTSGATNDLGFVGTVDFGTNSTSSGTYTLGDNVDLITRNAVSPAANTQTTFKDANGATLRFAGTSTVTGDLGAANNADNQNFRHIYAGTAGETVTFNGKVFVSSSTFYVDGTGTVNFNDNLYGPLVYNAAGTVNVADGKAIYPSVDPSQLGSVTTATNGTGILNFLGSTTTQVPMGTSALRLNQVNFHSSTSVANATVNIANDVYANTTTIGNGTGNTTANITATGKFLGNALTLSNKTTLNTAGAFSSTAAISPVDFSYGFITNGTLAPTATVTQSTTGTGAITANDATLNFAVGTQNWDATNGGGLISTSGSSKITGGTNSTLTLGANSKVNLALLGSLRNGQTVTLIDTSPAAGSTTYAASAATVLDNSYVMTTSLTQGNNSGDLVLQVSRAADVYIAKSATTGHFSNPAALRLGTLAYNGTGYSQDIQTVLNKLDIDQWGYGNNQANLAVQAKRLAPIANNSLAMTAFDAASMGTDSIGVRIHELRSRDVPSPYATTNLWIKNNMMSGTQSARGDYDGYTQRIGGLTGGIDSHPNKSSLVGVAVSYSNSKVRQQDFRAGDEASIEMTQGSLYGAYDITEDLFVDGILSIAKQQTKGIRTTVVGRTASYDVNGTQTGYKFSLGHRFGISDTNMTLTPLLSYESRNLKQDAYQETGAGDIGLSMAQQSLRRNQTGVGIRWASTEYMGGIVVKPEATLTRLNYSGNYDKAIQASFIGDLSTNAVFQTQPVEGTAGATKLSLGAGLLLNKTSSMMVRYDHFRRDAYRHNALELLVRWDF